MKQYIGLDFGGTNLKAGVVNVETGEITQVKTIRTQPYSGPQGVMHRMGELINKVIITSEMKKSSLGGIGIGVPGKLDMDNGLTRFLTNLPGHWPNVPLAATIREMTGLPVYLINDVRAITFGEWKFGAGKGVSSMACFAIGTGIGGGLIIADKLVLGIEGSAGEVGHISIDHDGPVCGCGSRGCVEVYASGPAIAAAGIKAVVQGLTTSIGKLVDYDLNKITPELVYKAAEQGDPIALDIFEKAGYFIGVAVANVLTTVGSRKVVIGGGVAQAGDLLLNAIRKTINERVKLMPVEQVEVVPAALGTNAGIIGAAAWAADRIRAS
jgi:glucokinase